MSKESFEDFKLNKQLRAALEERSIVEPTTIQKNAYSPIMAGKNVMGIAQTGTGKTLAYLLPLLRLWKFSKDRYPQVLILVPTRELVMQVVEELNWLTQDMNVVNVGVYGGANIKKQMEEVQNGLDFLVGTPGRIADLVYKGSLRFRDIKRLVIDEVDEMLELGFRHQLVTILDMLPKKRQNLMFSATMTHDVETFIEDYFDFFTRVEAAPTGTPLENITQVGYAAENFNTKMNLLFHLLETDDSMEKILVFAQTKKMADRIFERIQEKYEDQFDVIHSNKSQNYRFNVVDKFQSGAIKGVIATDIVARGLDIADVSHVINIDTPEVPENYMHRIGRTGRADKKGNAILFSSPKEAEWKENLELLMGRELPLEPLPADVETSDELLPEEQEQVKMPNLDLKMGRRIDTSVTKAFHEKKDKNKKVNKRRERPKPKGRKKKK